MASRQSAQGPAQYLALAAAPALARTQQPRKHLAVHPSELAIEPNLQILRRYRPSLLLRLEHPHRSTVENHVHRPARLGNRTSANMRIGIRGAFSVFSKSRGAAPNYQHHRRVAELVITLCLRPFLGALVTSIGTARPPARKRTVPIDVHDEDCTSTFYRIRHRQNVSYKLTHAHLLP